MPEAYWNGEFVPEAELTVAVWDIGFLQGVAVSERMRTFGGRLFRLDEHLARLRHSAEIVGLADPLDIDALAAAAEELARRHHQRLDPGDDVGVSLFVTPGLDSTASPSAPSGPRGSAGLTIGMHAYPLPFHTWSDKYTTGQRLRVSRVQQVPIACWPAELKCRSRMHYYLADREARLADPDSRAVLLDGDGHVIEASTANVVMYREDEGFVSPPREKILPGVSVGMLEDLCGELNLPFLHRDITVADLAAADEILLSSTSPCLIAVSSLNGTPLGDGRPGKQFRAMLSAWSERVGLDIQTQAERFARRR